MKPAIPSIKKEKAYIRIVDTVIHMIAEGNLQYNDKLYTEQELMTMLGVSRPTLREALRVLEFLGVAEVRPHNGISICSPNDQDGYLPLLYVLAFEKTSGRELFELRQALQLEMTYQAAARRNPEAIETLKSILQKTESALADDGDTFSQLDYEFHQQIIRAADNRLILKLMNTVSSMVQNQLNVHNSHRINKQRKETLQEHQNIVREIESGNCDAARQAMFNHLRNSREDAAIQ